MTRQTSPIADATSSSARTGSDPRTRSYAPALIVVLSASPFSIERLGDAAGVSPNGAGLLTPGQEVTRPRKALDTGERGVHAG